MADLLIVSAWAPPMAGGSPIALGKRLAAFRPRAYAIVTNRRKAFNANSGNNWLPANHYFLGDTGPSMPAEESGAPPPRPRISRRQVAVISPILRFVRDLVQLTRGVALVRCHTLTAIKREQPTQMLITADDGMFLLGGYFAAKASRLPYDVMLLDIYARNAYSLFKRLMAQRMEGLVLRRARRVFVTNDATRDHYLGLYGIRATVVEHSAVVRSVTSRPATRPATILYTGAIYWAQQDALSNLCDAVKSLPYVRVHLSTDVNERQLRRLGLLGWQVTASHVAAFDVPRRQLEADVLFLPLAFRTAAPDVIKTAAPGKLAEYLVSGVPILVHAPSFSYVARDARARGWGLVVDQLSHALLARAIVELLEDDALRTRLVDSAVRTAQERHDESQIAKSFSALYS
jgi:glycosyltransferase involved in cell wall biosynthesis